MADWIDCELTVLGDKETLTAFETKAKGHVQRYVSEPSEQEALSFHQLYPVPEQLTATYYSEESYIWERQHWGCKHGAKHSKVLRKADDSLVYSFLVSRLPAKWLRKVSRDYPDLVFHLDFKDECDLSEGRIVVENGLLFEQSGDI